jgi:hypothetical protein
LLRSTSRLLRFGRHNQLQNPRTMPVIKAVINIPLASK